MRTISIESRTCGVPREKTKSGLVDSVNWLSVVRRWRRFKRNVLRLDIRRLDVDDVEMLVELDDVAGVFERAVALAAIEIGNMRRAADADKGDVIAAERDIVVGAGAAQVELRRRGAQGFGDKTAIDADHQRRLVDRRAARLEEPARLFVQNLDAQFLEHAQGRVVNGGDPVVAEGRLAHQRIDELAVVDAALRTLRLARIGTAAAAFGARWPVKHRENPSRPRDPSAARGEKASDVSDSRRGAWAGREALVVEIPRPRARDRHPRGGLASSSMRESGTAAAAVTSARQMDLRRR